MGNLGRELGFGKNSSVNGDGDLPHGGHGFSLEPAPESPHGGGMSYAGYNSEWSTVGGRGRGNYKGKNLASARQEELLHSMH